jgi:hypothetical protein
MSYWCGRQVFRACCLALLLLLHLVSVPYLPTYTDDARSNTNQVYVRKNISKMDDYITTCYDYVNNYTKALSFFSVTNSLARGWYKRMYHGLHLQCVVYWQQWCHMFTKIPWVKNVRDGVVPMTICMICAMTLWSWCAARKWLCYVVVRTVNITEKERCLGKRTVMITHHAWR